MLMLLLRSVLSIVKNAQRERKTSGEIVAPTGKEKRKKKGRQTIPLFFQSLSFSHFRSAKSTLEKAPKAQRIKCLFSIKKRNAEWKSNKAEEKTQLMPNSFLLSLLLPVGHIDR
jgi:hypothetical protein